MSISINSLKPSLTIIYNGELFTIITCEHAKVARGSGFCRVKLRNLKNAQNIETTLRDSDNVEEASLEKRKLQYLYSDGDIYHFLDLETYEDLIMSELSIKETVEWLKDNLEINGIFYQNQLINLDLPLSMDLKVIETDPGFRGDTVKSSSKSAKLETGITIQVPLFIEANEKIKVDTRTKTYLGRA